MAHRPVPAMHRIRTRSGNYGQLLPLLRFMVVRRTRGLLRGADQTVARMERSDIRGWPERLCSHPRCGGGSYDNGRELGAHARP